MTFLPWGTLKTAAHRLAYLQSRAWMPPALLLLALSSVFLFVGDRGYYYKDHSTISHSSKFLAITDNLSFENPFRMFIYQTLDEDGDPAYRLYNRFPIGSFALLKLTFLPFGNDMSAEIFAARILMLLSFAAAAVLAYLSLCRIASSQWLALTAVLLAFSSAYCLYFSDMIFNEAFMDMFAVMLCFHGMVMFEQEGRFRQLSIKACIALLLGWHVYALLLPFITFGLTRAIVKSWSNGSPASGALRQLKHTALSLTRSRYLTIGVVTLLFGISVLTFNFTNEYLALNRETPLTKLPSFQSMIIRAGVEPWERETFTHYTTWTAFSERQFYRIGVMSLPYAFSPTYTDLSELFKKALPRPFIIFGIAVFAATLIGLLFIHRHKILLASLALSGFCWALPFRYSTAYPWHNFEALFYIGVALTLFSLLLMWIRRLSGERLVAALAVAALLVFIISALRMAQLNNPNRTDEPQLHKAVITDFENIRNMTDDGNVIWVNSMFTTSATSSARLRTLDYYFARRFTIDGPRSAQAPIDFVVTDARAYELASLTPQNQMLFLYVWDDFNKHIDQIIAQADALLVRSDFDVYHAGGMLIYVKEDCSKEDIGKKFFLAVHPAYKSALSDERRQHGFDDFSFHFQDRAVRIGEQCIAMAPLPEYIIHHIHTGQYIYLADGSYQHTWGWNGKIHRDLSPTAWAALDETIEQTGEPLIRSNFDVYQDDGTLIYVKEDCSEDDISKKFFLSVHPSDESDLSADRRQYGFDNIDLRFQNRAVRRGERCIAIAPLPDYAIDHIHTGQYIYRADGLFEHTWEWNGKINRYISSAVWTALNETIEQAGAPLVRSYFNVYQDNGTLIYVKDGCRADDASKKFFLVVYPADESDLPVDRRQYGFDNIDLRFQDRAARRGERCIAIAPLPEYSINRIHTGQYINRADGSFEHTWEWNGKIYPTD